MADYDKSSEKDTLYKIGQEVWCVFREIYYKARVFKIGREVDDEQYYYVHYFKFSKRFDELLRESRLLSMNKENNIFVRKFNKKSSDKFKENKKLRAEIIKNVSQPLSSQPPFLRLKRLPQEQVDLIRSRVHVEQVPNEEKELANSPTEERELANSPTEERELANSPTEGTELANCPSEERELANSPTERKVLPESEACGKKINEDENKIDSLVDEGQQTSVLELPINSSSTTEQDLEQSAIKTLDNMLNSSRRQNVNKSNKDQSQFAVNVCGEVTTSNKEELLLKNPACLIKSNDGSVNKMTITINNFENEVTTSDEQLLNGQKDILHNKKVSSFGKSPDIENVDEVDTTSKLDSELKLNEQENVISSNNDLFDNNTSTNDNFDAEVTTSKQEDRIGLNDQHITCCKLDRLLSLYRTGGPIRISSVAIVAERSETENVMDYEQRILHDTNSLGGNTSLIITTAVSNNAKQMNSEENNSTNCMDKNVPLLYTSNASAEKSDTEFGENCKFNKNNSFGNTSSVTSAMENNNKRKVDEIDEDNCISKKKCSANEINYKKNNISFIKEFKPYKKELESSVIKLYDNKDIYEESNKTTIATTTTVTIIDEDDNDVEKSTVISKYCETEVVDHDEIDEKDIDMKEATSNSQVVSINEIRKDDNHSKITDEDDVIMKEEVKSTVVTTISKYEMDIDDLARKTTDEIVNKLNAVKTLSTSTVISNSETKVGECCNNTTSGILSSDNSVLSLNESNFSQTSSSSTTTKIKIKQVQNSDDEKTDDPSKSDLKKKDNGSGIGSASTSLSNHPEESDNENDGQISDDNHDAKNKKVTIEKLSDEDHSIFELFGYEKSYSRAAKVKANVAISQMSKTPINKEKKNETVKRLKNGKKKDDDDLSDELMSWSKYNIDIPQYIHRILIEDKHLLEDDRFIPHVPAKLSVYSILHDFNSKFPVPGKTRDTLLNAFNDSLEWLLHSLEKPKYHDILQKNPDISLNQIYGFPHLLRFLIRLPKMFHMIRNNSDSAEYIANAVFFVRGLLVYLEDENLPFGIDHYDPVLPDTYRRAYY